MDLDAELDCLYAAPLDEFVKVRDALAASLRKEGDKERSAAVKKLVRPSVSAWVVNQLYRRRRDGFDELLGVSDELRGAQTHALSGGGGDLLRAALSARREAVSRLVAAARDVLEEGGHAASAGTLQRVEGTLHALASMENRPQLGRLSVDVQQGGLEALVTGAPAVLVRAETPRPAPAPKAPPPAAGADEAAAKARKARKEAAEAALDRARKDFAVREGDLRTAQTALSEAKTKRARVAEDAAAGRRRVQAAEAALEEAKVLAQRSDGALRDAAAATDGAARALDDAERALERARAAREATLAAILRED